MDLSQFPLLSQQHARINLLQNVANKRLAVSENAVLGGVCTLPGFFWADFHHLCASEGRL
jgi:hypothetical protein